MKKITLLLLIVSSTVFAQTGPAGIGNATGASGQPENSIWLDAGTLGLSDGTDVTTWTDISGNGVVFSASSSGNLPDFEINEVNGLPVVEFNDGNAERLNVNPFNNMAVDEITAIIVFATPNTGEGIISYAVTGESNEYLIYDANNIRTYVSNANAAGGDLSDGTSSFNIFTSTWNAAGGISNHYKNTSNVNSGAISNGASITNGGSLTIGGEQDNVDGGYATNQDFNGKIAEFILFKNVLNGAERLIIENYLSEKYGIIIGNDYFSGGGGAYMNDLRGIGTANGTAKFSASGFSDALQLSELNGSLNAANEFILFAHDNTAHAQGQTTDITVDPGVLDSHWARSWYIENSGDVSVELRFDFGDAGLTYSGDPTDYVLLYRPNTSSDYTRVLVNSYASENGDQVVVDASNANLASGYYTLGQGEQLVPGDIYSYQSGDWNDPLTWTTDPSGALRTPILGLVPASDDNVTILSGRTVTMDSDDNDGINLTVDGELIIANTSGHDFFNILGGGTISIAGDASSNDNFPSGSTNIFADSIVGGTVEIEGAGINLNQNRTFNNVIVNLNVASNQATLLSDYIINGNLTVERGVLRINGNSDATSRNISVYGTAQINASGELAVGTANARHEFNFYGDFNNSGRAEFTNRNTANYNNEATDGIVDANFLSALHNQEINCNGVTNFYRIEIDKGSDQTYILDINANSTTNFNLFGPADYGHASTAQLNINDNALGLLRGTVRLNNNVDVPVLNNGGNYNISEAARLWVNGGSAEKPSGTAIVPYGTIQLSGGVINAPVNSGITTRDNGNIVISDGVLTTYQIRTSVLGATNIGGYTQSGGTVNVTGDNIQTDYYTFSLTYPGNTFNMSGGTLKVSGARTGGNTGGIFIASAAGNQSVTGGTVIMEVNRDDNFKLTSQAPFWNVIMRYTSGSGNEIDLITGTSAAGVDATTIIDPDLVVLNDLTIESGITFDHNGNDVEIGSDFKIEAGGDYFYNNSVPNTTTINGVDDSSMSFLNRTGGVNDEQRFWNLIINKPTTATVTLESGKPDVTGNDNNLLRIEGDYFKVLSGTLDQGVHSIRMYADTVVNYDVCTVYNPAATNDTDPNSENDLFKLRDDGGPATVFITADTSRFGGIKLNSADEIINLISDLKIDYLEYRHGRMNLDVHNLTIDVLNVRLSNGQAQGPNGNGEFSVEDMFITAGNASDGGLSLKVNADGTNPGFINNDEGNTNSNPRVFSFPLGTGTSGVEASSEFTPANIRLLSATDEGYMTVVPVTKKLATAGPYPLGNDISDRYWIIDYRDFTTVPVVERLRFRSVEKDDPNGGADGFPGNYVPGYVLEDDPFTRTAEVNSGANSSSNIDNVDATNIRLFFWGNTGSGNPPGGFNLVNAAYTAGDPSKFIGAPEQFYVRVTNGYTSNVGSADDWNDGNTWSLVSHTGAAAGDYPQEGDIAIVRAFATSGERKVILGIENYSGDAGIDVDVARLIFEDQNVNNGGEEDNRIMIAEDANVNFGIVEGDATFQPFLSNTNTPVFNDSDFGNFVSQSANGAYFLFFGASDGVLNLPSEITTYPNVRFEGNNNVAIDRFFQFPGDAVINGDLLVDNRATFRLNRNVTVTDDFRLGAYRQGFLQIDGSNGAIVLDIADDFQLRSDGDNRVFINNSAGNLEHKVIVRGDIDFNNNTVSEFDLFTDLTTGDNVIIELATDDESNESWDNDDRIVPELYKLVMNGGSDRNTSFQINTNFTLPDADASFRNLEILNGELILNNSSINAVVADGLDLTIPASGALRITQGNLAIQGDNTGILLDGSLIIDGGTLDMDDAIGNGNNFIEYSASGNAILEISAGTLDVGSQIRPITSASTGVLKYRQTGGNVRIGTQAGPTSNRGMLQIYNVGSEFTYTGGTLTIERHQTSPTIAALYLDPDDYDVSQEITIFNLNTPAGQNDFRINSFMPLNDLTINGTNNPTALIRTNPLTINGTLTINSGATFNGNGITLTANGDFENNGVYNAQSNETIFNSNLTQEIRGSGTNNFFRFTKTGSGSLELTNTIEVDGLFSIASGVVNDNANDIILLSDAVIDGTHSSSAGNGLVFSGAANQELRRSSSGTSDIGGVRINNSNGVTIPNGNGYNFNIDNDLQLNGGVFDVGGSNILFGENSDVVAVQPFSVSNMIRTNSSFVDKGVGKTFTASTTTDFVFPLGQAYYTPVEFDLSSNSNTSGSTTGTIYVSPANEYHPTIDDGNDVTAGGDINNVLQYYWSLTAENITGMTSDVAFRYNDALVQALNGSEADYIAARILTFNNPTNLINKFTTNEVNELTNEIDFAFNGSDSNGISGDYFAGIDLAIPDNVATYTVDTNGSFTTDVYDIAVPGGGAPSGSVVIVPNGFTLSLDQNDARFYRTVIQPGGVLEIDNSSNHRLGILDGTGDLRIISDGINANLPAFSGDFLSCTGGGLEYAGTGNYNILGGITTVRSLTLSGSGTRSFPNNDLTVCDDLTIDGPVVNNTNNRNITVDNDLIMLNGTFNSGTGIIAITNNFVLNGGTFDGQSNGSVTVRNDLLIQGGTYNSGGGGNLNLEGNLQYSSGTYLSGSGSHRVRLVGTGNQVISGNFTGASGFYRLLIANSAGATVSSGSIEVDDILFLNNGIIATNGNRFELSSSATISPSLGKSNAFIEGELSKTISSSGQSFTFPVGDAGRWRPATVQNVSAGGLTWEAEFKAAGGLSDPVVDNYDLTNPSEIATILQSEHWVISDGNAGTTGVTATVGLSWGTESDVSSVFAEREEMQVMIWSDASSSWDNLGGGNFSSGHTQSQGRFVADNNNFFSEHIYTIGSSNSANPLPVSLISFVGNPVGGSVKLEWKTSSELNNDYFEIEHSTDGVSFSSLGFVSGSGTTSEENTYTLYHEQPQAGYNFYRLKQVDFDGKSSFEGGIVSVQIDGFDGLAMVPFPNPTTSDNVKIMLNINDKIPALIEMYDIVGNRHLIEQVTKDDLTSNEYQLNLSTNLAPGLYILKLRQGVESIVKRVMIKER